MCSTFQHNFCLGRISNGFSATDPRQLYLNENVFDFSVD